MTKVVSIFLAFQVLLSSLSFNIGMHFCGDQLQNFSFFEKAQPCEHAKTSQADSSSCPFHKVKAEKEEKGCCGDKNFSIQGQEHESVLSSYSIDFKSQLHFLDVFTSRFFVGFFQNNLQTPKYYNYKPPLIRIDIPVLIQTFLI